jgi:hypothetical protein
LRRRQCPWLFYFNSIRGFCQFGFCWN